ncbi:MAG: hypothetical protein WBQ55_07985 [Xanthobacteraceae bacterium]
MDDAFAGVEKACQWDDHPQYALVHWAMETSVKGAEGFPVRLSAFEVARGVKLGGTNAQSIANRDEALQRAEEMRPILGELAGMSANKAAAELNRKGIATPKGGQWHALTVMRLRERLKTSTAA